MRSYARGAVAAAAVLLTGCTSSAAVSVHARPTPTPPAPTAVTSVPTTTSAAPTLSNVPAVTDSLRRQLDAILTELRIESDIARALTTVPDTLVAATAARQLRNQLYAADAALRRLPVPAALQVRVNAVLTDDLTYLRGLDGLVALSDPADIRARFAAIGPDGGSPAPIDQAPSVKALRADAGLPDEPDLLTAPPPPSTVWVDDFSLPETVPLPAGATQDAGRLTVTTTTGAVVAPPHRHQFDAGHSSVQADFASPIADVSYGLVCPHVDGQSSVRALIRPNGAVSVVSQPPSGDPLTLYSNDQPNRAANPVRNTVRLDCENYAAGMGIVRVYVNGARVAGLGVPAGFPADLAAHGVEPAMAVAAGAIPAVVTVDNWSVSTLPALAAPPVPVASG